MCGLTILKGVPIKLLTFIACQGSLPGAGLGDMSDDSEVTAKYKEEIREMRRQLKQLHDVGNFRDDTGDLGACRMAQLHSVYTPEWDLTRLFIVSCTATWEPQPRDVGPPTSPTSRGWGSRAAAQETRLFRGIQPR